MTSSNNANQERVSQTNKKNSLNQTLPQKSPQRDKYLSCPTYKIFGTILKMDK